MEQFFEFLANHPLLFGALGVVIGMLAWTTLQSVGGGRVTPLDATRLINHEEAVVLDVRSDAEYAEGHIVGAVHLPEGQLKTSMGRLQKYKSKPVIAVCRSGQRSAAVCAQLRKEGFEKAHNLGGGVLAWQAANLPLTRK